MATNKVQLRTIEEFMADYTPVYAPMYPLFLGRSQAYAEEVGQQVFKRLQALGDIRTKHVTPKDTEIRQLSVAEGSKTFKKYFLANQYQQSALQERGQIEDVVRQVLDEHHKQADEMFLLGEGSSSSTMVNNSLFWSSDPNWVENSSAAINGVGLDPLIDFHAKVLATVRQAQTVSGRKMLMFYGTTLTPFYDGIFQSIATPFKAVLKQSLEGKDVELGEIPPAIVPAGANGWILVNLDQTKLHYTALPSLKAQGVNDEKMYAWFNFLMGSCMLDVTAPMGVIKQPATFTLS